jgi:hypothetical protein
LNIRFIPRFAVLTAALGLAGVDSSADEIKLVGTWEGFGYPLYTKLVISDDGWLTYCAVSSCRSVDCFDMAYEGPLDGTFTYRDELRSWTFERLSEFSVRGEVTTESGTSAVTVYELESLTPPKTQG